MVMPAMAGRNRPRPMHLLRRLVRRRPPNRFVGLGRRVVIVVGVVVRHAGLAVARL
jgi:hypothetical protein